MPRIPLPELGLGVTECRRGHIWCVWFLSFTARFNVCCYRRGMVLGLRDRHPIKSLITLITTTTFWTRKQLMLNPMVSTLVTSLCLFSRNLCPISSFLVVSTWCSPFILRQLSTLNVSAECRKGDVRWLQPWRKKRRATGLIPAAYFVNYIDLHLLSLVLRGPCCQREHDISLPQPLPLNFGTIGHRTRWSLLLYIDIHRSIDAEMKPTALHLEVLPIRVATASLSLRVSGSRRFFACWRRPSAQAGSTRFRQYLPRSSYI